MAKSSVTVLCVCAFILGTAAYQSTRSCGRQRVDLAPEASITGGRLAQEGEWPWQVALMDGDSFLCGGQLIKADWVLTAAHCITHLNNPEGHRIMMGSTNLNNFTESEHAQVRQVREFFPHPDYSNIISDYDLALIKLAQPFRMTDYVTPICLAHRRMTDVYTAGTMVTVTGWGAKRDMGPLPKQLHETTMPLVDQARCRQMYYGEDDITENMVCASPEGGGKGACGGDSGGPLVRKIGTQWWLLGTVLGGNGCGSPDFPSVFQRVVAFQDWISPVFSGRIPKGQTTRCTEDQFMCKEGWCIEYWRRCNLREDCMYSTDELYCEAELKMFNVQFDRRISYRSIIRNLTVSNSLECARECIRTLVPMKCGAFDTTPNSNVTRLCSLGTAAYSIVKIPRDQEDIEKVSHFTYRFKPEAGMELNDHVGIIMSPNALGSKRIGHFNWIINITLPTSNTIVFTVLSARAGANCEDLDNMAMLVVKGGKGGRRARRRRKKGKDRGDEVESVNYCLDQLEEGTEFRIASLYARVFFYTTHNRRFAFAMEYKTEYNCTKTLRWPSRLRSPLYPNKYPSSLECHWTYEASPGYVITLEMRDFFVEQVPDCEYDYVAVYDGDSQESPQIGDRHCGLDFGDSVTSTGNTLHIVFISDPEVNKNGFLGDISFVRARRYSPQRLIADVPLTDEQPVKEFNQYKYGLFGTVMTAFTIIVIMGVVCYKLKKRLDAANSVVRNIKRNNIVLEH